MTATDHAIQSRHDPAAGTRGRFDPSFLIRVFPVSVAAASLAALIVIGVHRMLQPQSPYDGVLASWAALTIAAALAFIGADRAGRDAAARPERGSNLFAAFLFAFEVGVLLLPIAVFCAVWRTRYEDITGWTYPILNKRWLIALYAIALATFLVFPIAFERWMSGPRLKELPRHRTGSATRRRSWNQLALGIVAAALAAWFLIGPPWHVERHHRPIDTHEQVHLGPLQAIDKGYLPYVGPASTQYGPGSQMLTFALMKATGRFDIVTFRQAQLTIQLAAVFVFSLIAYMSLGFWAMWFAVLIGVVMTPLSFFHGGPTIEGMYGWGNALRYLGPLIVVPVLSGRIRPERVNRSALALGVLWGFFAWVSQENLTTTFVAVFLLLLLMWLTDTVDGRSAWATGANVVAGFAVWWSAVLLYYALHGAALQFIRNYTLVSGAVAMGFSNTWWSDYENSRLLPAYYFTAPLAIAFALATLIDFRTRSFRRGLGPSHVRLLSFVLVLLACYQSALYRSDSPHLLNTLIALPFVLVLAIRDLPDWCADTWPSRAVLRLFLAIVVVAIYPLRDVLLDPYRWVLHPALMRFDPMPPPPMVAEDGRIPFRRATRYLSDEPHVGAGMTPMRQFLEAAANIRELIGTRPTYVDSVMAGGYTDLWYFLLDLTPGPILLERETMVINDELANEAAEHFRRHVREFKAVIAPGLGSREVQAFLEANPRATQVQHAIDGQPVYVLLAGPEATASSSK